MLGLVSAIAGVWVDDADAAEAASAVGRGFAGGPIYELSKAAGQKRAQVSSAAKAAAEAAAAAAPAPKRLRAAKKTQDEADAKKGGA